MSQETKQPSLLMVVIAFAILYIVWGSTYLFIVFALEGFPTTVLGSFRFSLAGLIMLIYCIIRKEKVWDWQVIKRASIVGVLLLFIGNGGVVFAENTISSSLAAIIVSAAPIWFVILDKKMWATNFKDSSTLLGLAIGFVGVVMLFYDSLHGVQVAGTQMELYIALLVIFIGCLCWTAGSIYNKYNATGSAAVNITWQMIAGAVAYSVAALVSGEAASFEPGNVTSEAFWSLIYLVILGSIAGYSAFIWLLQVRPITQVSTYAYVNPVVAVLLGVVFVNEKISPLQYGALAVILAGILLINLNKYRKKKKAKQQTGG